MPRIARVVAPGLPHHVTQRGNFGLTVFDDEADRRQYMEWLGEYARRYGVSFWAYCLLTNHVHFVAVPEHEDSLAKAFNHTHKRHSLAMNRKHGRRGHLWQGRFFSCVLDEGHLLSAVRYVERNPVRAGLVGRAEAYRWSSAVAHVGAGADALLSGDGWLREMVGNWRKWLSAPEDDDFNQQLRQSTRTGRPLGSDDFMDRMESRLARCVKAKPRGRPRREISD